VVAQTHRPKIVHHRTIAFFLLAFPSSFENALATGEGAEEV